jgi:hypothetical protein
MSDTKKVGAPDSANPLFPRPTTHLLPKGRRNRLGIEIHHQGNEVLLLDEAAKVCPGQLFLPKQGRHGLNGYLNGGRRCSHGPARGSDDNNMNEQQIDNRRKDGRGGREQARREERALASKTT